MTEIAMNEIMSLSVSERIQLVQDVWDSITGKPEKLEVTEAQKRELDRRIEYHKEHPDDGSSWDEVKKRITER